MLRITGLRTSINIVRAFERTVDFFFFSTMSLQIVPRIFDVYPGNLSSWVYFKVLPLPPSPQFTLQKAFFANYQSYSANTSLY